MLVLTLGAVLTVVLLAKVGYWSRMRTADLGSMSYRWTAAHNAAQPSSPQ